MALEEKTLNPTQVLRDIEEIKNLKARYLRYVDIKDWTAWDTVFTPDAQIEMGGAIRTRDEFVSLTSAWLEGSVTAHTGHMPEIKVTGPDTATGVWAMDDLVIFPNPEGPDVGFHGYGHYHEEYWKLDGEWRIHNLRLTRLHLDPMPGGFPPGI